MFLCLVNDRCPEIVTNREEQTASVSSNESTPLAVTDREERTASTVSSDQATPLGDNIECGIQFPIHVLDPNTKQLLEEFRGLFSQFIK